MSDALGSFQQYVDAAAKAAERSRSTLYLIIVATFVVLLAYRYSQDPNWVGARLANLQKAEGCLEAGLDKQPGVCTTAVKYAEDGSFSYDSSLIRPPVKSGITVTSTTPAPEGNREILHNIDHLLDAQQDENKISLPILGVNIDCNDIGIIGSIVLTMLMFVFYSCLIREREAFEFALKRIESDQTAREHANLLWLAPVLTWPNSKNLARKALLILFFALPAAVIAYVVYTDLGDFEIGINLIGRAPECIQVSLEALFTILVFYLTGLSHREWNRIGRQLEEAKSKVREPIEEHTFEVLDLNETLAKQFNLPIGSRIILVPKISTTKRSQRKRTVNKVVQ